uniref:SCP domain-containing protein n=1 Tax=Leersia perrieri TaxID=77586 RepID=A0A0D9WKL1_9ORYZ
MAMATSVALLVLVLIPFYAVARAEPRNLAQGYGGGGSNSNSSAAGVSPTNGMGWYKGMTREFVNGHNAIRARYGAKPLKWDKKLARQARRWSDTMRTDCVLRHSTGSDFAESLYIGRSGWKAMAHNAMDTWAGNEERIYDPVTRACKDGLAFKACGHFAFMVDPRFTRMGCARSECFNQAGVFITCNYYF